MRKSTRINRLQKLHDFLIKLPEKKFDFSSYVTKTDDKGCGTICCAAGWLPRVDPKNWKWVNINTALYSSMRLKIDSTDNAEFDLRKYFGINENLYNNLFESSIMLDGSHRDNIITKLKQPLDRNATAKQVAKRIKSAIDLLKKDQLDEYLIN